MTVATVTNLIGYPGDDAATVFPFPFPVYDADHLVVYSKDLTTRALTLVTVYTTSGIGNENGGSITLPLALAVGKKLLISRVVPYTQDLDVENQGGFYPENFETELDLITMQIQQLREEMSRSVRAQLDETFAVLPTAPERRGNLLGFTDDVDATPTVDTDTLLFNVLAAVLAAGPGIEISAAAGSITITNSSIQDCWLLEGSGGGGGGSSTAEDIRDIIGVALHGLGCVITVDDAGDTITVDLTQAATAEVIRDVIGTALTAGTLVTITPNDGADTITVAVDTSALAERTRDTIGTALIAGSGIAIAVDDAGDTITFSAVANILSVVSAATVTPTFAYDQVNITAQAAGLTLANPTGTAIDGHGILIRVKDNGTSRALAYGTKYRVFNDALPAATVVSKVLYIGMVYNLADDMWDVLGVRTQA